jgi:hypothetical protein
MNRVARAARVHLLGWPTTMAAPVTVLFSAFGINLAIFWVLQDRGIESSFTGGLASLYITVMLVFIQLMGRQLSFATGFGLTRRTYYLATMLFVVALSLVAAVALELLRLLEQATNGWGVHMPFYRVAAMNVGNPLGQIAVYAGPLVLLATFGTFIGAIFARWRTAGLVVAGILAMLLGGLAVVLISYGRDWTSIGSWFADQPHLALYAGWPLLLAVVLGLAAYRVVRLATP